MPSLYGQVLLLVKAVTLLLHHHNRAQGLPLVHQLKGLIDLSQGLGESHKLIHHKLLVHIVIHQLGHTVTGFPTW